MCVCVYVSESNILSVNISVTNEKEEVLSFKDRMNDLEGVSGG